MRATQRYDAVADFYEAGWTDSYDDSVSSALLDQIGPIDGLRILDVACGHGRIARELARRGARVLGIDISAGMLEKGQEAEESHPLGARYLLTDVTSPECVPAGAPFDVVVCSFGLSDIDDLDSALQTVARSLRPGGRFVFSLLHPCFPGAGEVSGSWAASGTYYDEGWWLPDGSLSSLRRQVGANHRMLATYFNALRAHHLHVEAVTEPPPPDTWTTGSRAKAARHPIFLVVSCCKVAIT